MPQVHEILEYLFSFAPESLRADWDRVGLFCGRGGREVRRVLIALDPSMAAIREAADWGAELLVTHHPLLFHATRDVSDQTEEGRKVLALAEHGIAVICMHTNLDCAAGGVNDCLAEKLGLERVSALEHGSKMALCRVGTIAPQSLEAFARHVKAALGLSGLRYASGGKPVEKVAVGGGSCIEFAALAAAQGCDTFVTGDVKYHEFQKAETLGLNILDAGHFGTENPVCAKLLQILQTQFPQLSVQISQSHRDVVKFC